MYLLYASKEVLILRINFVIVIVIVGNIIMVLSSISLLISCEGSGDKRGSKRHSLQVVELSQQTRTVMYLLYASKEVLILRINFVIVIVIVIVGSSLFLTSGAHIVCCCCCLPTPMALASGGSPMFPLVVHQPASPSIWPAVQSLRRGLSTNPGATMWCVCGCS